MTACWTSTVDGPSVCPDSGTVFLRLKGMLCRDERLKEEARPPYLPEGELAPARATQPLVTAGRKSHGRAGCWARACWQALSHYPPPFQSP
jgi:hypothetical protein